MLVMRGSGMLDPALSLKRYSFIGQFVVEVMDTFLASVNQGFRGAGNVSKSASEDLHFVGVEVRYIG